jgi:hypothetical protein
LIGIRDPRGRDLQKSVSEGVEQAAVADAPLKDSEVVQECLVALWIKNLRYIFEFIPIKR